MTKKIWLIILDWFWINEKIENNAIKKANSPTIDDLFNKAYTKLEASEEHVWLPKWQMWNSEVWHLAIGSGRVSKQPLVEITDLFINSLFHKIDEFEKWIEHVKKYNSKLHLFWLFWSGWVHAHIDQMIWKIKIIPKDVKVCLHLFSDGRDLARDSMLGEFEEFEIFLNDYDNVEVTTISWRFHAMDRDNNWDRIELVYNTMVKPETILDISPIEFIKQNYENEIYDEFFSPTNFTWNKIEDNDAIFHLNFRSDRAVQLTKAFYETHNYFMKKNIENLYISTMTKYYKEYDGNVFIKPAEMYNTLWEVLSKNNMTQLHLAETEKFAHVTKFFNWWKQIVFPGQKDILIPSPKVKTYDMQPEMSAYEILETYKNEVNNYDFTVINFANWDMIGHTWVMDAAVSTVEILDDVVSQLLKLSKENNVDLYITADHWNCEVMFDEEWNIVTSHTTNKVPFWYIKEWEFNELGNKYWTLANIAPTILDNFGIDIPEEMNSNSLR